MVKEHPLTEWEESMLGRLIKAPDQLLHIYQGVPAKKMSSNSAIYKYFQNEEKICTKN